MKKYKVTVTLSRVWCLLGLVSLVLVSCSHLFYYPSKEIFAVPDIPYEEVYFSAQDGVKLHGRLFLSAADVKGTVVQYHGNAGNLTSHAVGLTWIVPHGYHLFVFDYRGYGQSQSEPSPAGIRLDGLAALEKTEEIHRQHGAGGKLLVVGQSLGGAVALRAIEDHAPAQTVDLLVVDSGFASYRMVASKVLASNFLTWAISPLGQVVVSDETAADLRKFRHPLLVMHSVNDRTVPFACGEAVYNEASSAKKFFWRGEEDGHMLGFYTDERQKKFLAFINNPTTYE